MSLQLAAKYENAVLDLKVLNEASILYRKDTIDALDELKQRILLREPLSRTLPGSPNSPNHSRDSFESVQSSLSLASSSVPPNALPKGVRISAGGDPKNEKTGLARYFSMQRNNSKASSTTSKTAVTPASENNNFHPALNYLLRGKGPEERQSTMKDIDEIIAAYQGLRMEGDRTEALHTLNSQPDLSRRDTLAVLQGGNGYKRDTVGLNHDALELLKNLPPTSGGHHENSEYPAVTHNIFHQHSESTDRRVSDWINHPQPAPASSRWSAASGTSSIYSEHTVCSDPPSSYRRDSDSSRGSHMSPMDAYPRGQPSNHAASVYSTAPSWPVDRMQYPPPSSSLASSTTSRSSSITPLSMPPPTPPSAPFASQQRPRTPPVLDTTDGLTAGRTRVHLVPPQDYTYKADPSVALYPPLKPGKSSAALSVKPAAASPQEKMMDGRPCKDNNYWGFCKGAWATREDAKKGLALETRPEGMYSTSQIWQCRHCCFEGKSLTIPHPTKKNKKETVIDPSVHVSAGGIRYKWIFLAKSHVKKKNVASEGPRSGARKGPEADADCSYGCVLCSVEGNVTGIYGNVETLMNHVFMEHVRPGSMTESTMIRSKCIVGRVAGADEEWDINIPTNDALIF